MTFERERERKVETYEQRRLRRTCVGELSFEAFVFSTIEIFTSLKLIEEHFEGKWSGDVRKVEKVLGVQVWDNLP